jgi:hypothetical protein
VRAVSTAASTARHTVVAIFEALLILAIIGALVFGAASLAGLRPAGSDSVFAAKGGNGGGNGGNAGANGGSGGGQSATINLVQLTDAAVTANWPTVDSRVAFAVTANVKPSDTYLLWVANRCYQDGVVVSAEFQPVQDSVSGPFTLSWGGGGAASCTAYVWIYPDTGTALSGGSMDYSVSP